MATNPGSRTARKTEERIDGAGELKDAEINLRVGQVFFASRHALLATSAFVESRDLNGMARAVRTFVQCIESPEWAHQYETIGLFEPINFQEAVDRVRKVHNMLFPEKFRALEGLRMMHAKFACHELVDGFDDVMNQE